MLSVYQTMVLWFALARLFARRQRRRRCYGLRWDGMHHGGGGLVRNDKMHESDS